MKVAAIEVERQQSTPQGNNDDTKNAKDSSSSNNDDSINVAAPLLSNSSSRKHIVGGLILTSYFSFRQDPRHIGKYEHKLATFESMYHFHTTVVHYQLHAIIFHDGVAFDGDFVQKYTYKPYVQFVQVDPPTFGGGEPIITPNDYRYIIFDRYFQNHNRQQRMYEWYLIADLDIFFNRNPFEKLSEYHQAMNYTFFGSWDGGQWKDEQVRLQRKLFRRCYGYEFIKNNFREEVEWETPNGNCGLWAGNFEKVSCVMSCMAQQYTRPPVQGKGSSTLCGRYCFFSFATLPPFAAMSKHD
jgi:hypothetical protein